MGNILWSNDQDGKDNSDGQYKRFTCSKKLPFNAR